MSIIHNIITKRNLDISLLNKNVLKFGNVVFEERGENTFNYWVEGKSTRGVNITIENKVIDVKNNYLSNRDDYILTNNIVREIILMTDGEIFDEDDTNINTTTLFDDDKINEFEQNDCDCHMIVLKEKDSITIFGTIRKVHFGQRLYKNLKEFYDNKLKDKIFEIIKTVNYKIPNFEYGDILQVGDGDDKKIMKVLTNKIDLIIDKYDNIFLFIESKNPIMITNEILNSILPTKWTLVDEYTIVAPIINPDEWDNLIMKAKNYDLFDSYISKQ